jgi:hypothetical protein
MALPRASSPPPAAKAGQTWPPLRTWLLLSLFEVKAVPSQAERSG